MWGVLDAANAFEGKPINAPPQLLDGDIHWPNQATLAPPNAVGGGSVLLEAGGFFANPLKATGQIVLTDISASPPTHTQISHDKSNFFYHHAVWRDINNDGRLDVVAARAMDPTIPIGHKPQAELLWLEQPTENPMTSSWQEHVLTSGPGVAFIFEDLNGDGSDEVVAAQFFEEPGLFLYTCAEPSWASCNVSNVKQTAIDVALGTFYFKKIILTLSGLRSELFSLSAHHSMNEILIYAHQCDSITSIFSCDLCQIPSSETSCLHGCCRATRHSVIVKLKEYCCLWWFWISQVRRLVYKPTT